MSTIDGYTEKDTPEKLADDMRNSPLMESCPDLRGAARAWNAYRLRKKAGRQRRKGGAE